MKIAVAGAGAFGSGLAISLARDDKDVALVARTAEAAAVLIAEGRSPKLNKYRFPKSLKISSGDDPLKSADVILLAVPTQKLGDYLAAHKSALAGKYLVACCKGIDITSLKGPTGVILDSVPDAKASMLTGPSFADDIAQGLPTALVVATKDPGDGEQLQQSLTTSNIRLYRSTDTVGAELGGALKNVIAIGAGIAIGSGLGDSARAAMMTRGFSEMRQVAEQLGADASTLYGLSGFGDLTLTCTSTLSRNFCYGLSLGRKETPDTTKTVEGVSTAKAVMKIARKFNLDLPVCGVVDAICNSEITIENALLSLLARPLREE